MTFTIEYISNEGLCIGFDIEDEYEMEESNLDYKIARYMNKLAINGILKEKKLHKRADKWRVLEDANDGRHMSLNFYCHIPRTIEAHVKMPRTTDIDIIERDSGLYDYSLVPRDKIVKKISQTTYIRDNRSAMNKNSNKCKVKPRKNGTRDVQELVELPSVQLQSLGAGFVPMVEWKSDTYGRCGSNKARKDQIKRKQAPRAKLADWEIQIAELSGNEREA